MLTSTQMEVRVHSASVKVAAKDKRQLIPVFGEGDKVSGTVTLDSKAPSSGHLIVSVEGAFFYDESSQSGGSKRTVETRKHVFWATSTNIQVSPSLDSFLSLSTPRGTFRDGFTSTIRSIRRRPSASSLNSNATVPPSPISRTPMSPGFARTYSFSFDLPHSNRKGEEMPPTFMSVGLPTETPVTLGGPTSAEVNAARSFGVEYKISVAWEPTEAFEYPSFVTAPIYYHPDTEFQSFDASPSQESGSWLEMPLRFDRPLPFRCAVTLPTSVSFSRSSSIPYYVVFTTSPRNPALAKEIATDATISATLIRQITVTEPSSYPPTPPRTPSAASDESDGIRGVQLLKRVVKPLSPRTSDETIEDVNKDLPRLPMHAVFKDSRLLHTSICIGFPKRPRQHPRGDQNHPSLEAQSSLPDGLHKAKFNLNKDMLPSIDWSGVSVKRLELRVEWAGWAGKGRGEAPSPSPRTMSDHPTTSWQAMHDSVFYRRQQLYTVAGKFPDLGDYIIAGCRYGGPLALMRDNTKLIAVGRATPAFSKSQIQVYSSAGEGLLLFSVDDLLGLSISLWEHSRIIRFGWTMDEKLVVLNEEGVYRMYDLQGDYQQYSLGSEASEMGVIDARIHENGLVALTGSLALLEVKGWEGARPMILANPNLADPPVSWGIIPPDANISRHIEVLLSVDNTIYTVDNLESVDQRLSQGPFTHVSPSPNGKSLALLNSSGTLLVVSSDFQRRMAEFNTLDVPGAQGDVKQVEWCGNDVIVVTWESLAVLVGPFADTLQYFYVGNTFAITEPDGIRIFSSEVCDLIQKVPTSTLSIFRPGSTSPAAILYDAWESFSQRSPKADESIRSIRPELAAAVDGCIDAAGQEWEPFWQRRLLSAAKFGQGFLDLYNPTDFINMGQTLKVLNAVRFYEIGLPLTYAQYSLTSPTHLISRLTSRNMHLLALRISTFLSLRPDVVLKHWASAKILKSRPTVGGTGKGTESDGDDEVCRLIVDKFKQLGGVDVSYAEIAKRAWEVGRTGLATKLLDHEKRGSDQVPLLLSMKEDRLALQKAVDSGDTDLEGGESLAPASRLLQVYAREQDRDMLRDFYYSDDRRVESAVLAMDEASRITDPTARITAVKSAQKFFSEDRDRAFEAKQQLEAESDGKISFFGQSVNETIHSCIVNGLVKRADKIKSDFRVSEKRFWFTKLYALTEIRDFEGLETFSKSKRSPIGYEPFVRHLVEKGHTKEAVTYVARCDPPKRADLYAECDEWRMAGKECKDRGDKVKLEQLRKKCPNSLVARELEQIAASMK
ncbi:hypothetical protein D9757_004539 [Collybiopsis confluens]|uniref:Vacuolar protein sorting-associated protein 16 homolog n=1 Tax=Collybiopsis confluens TaxID=2823264 RepID=A0A8H5HWH9_9AGAR|nr:hypothetical protein D9757_004539 [Collybiopsis confluens]